MNWLNMKEFLRLIMNKLSNNSANIQNIKYNMMLLLHLFENIYKKKYEALKNKQVNYLTNTNLNSKLVKFSHIKNYRYMIYNFNKYELYKSMLISRLTSKLIYDLINTIYMNKKNIPRFVNNFIYIVISKPKVKINLSEVKIIFYYYLPGYKPSMLLYRTLAYFNSLNKKKLSAKLLLKNKNMNYFDSLFKMNYTKYNFIVNMIQNILKYRDNKHFTHNVNNILNSKVNNIYNVTFYNLMTYKFKYKILNLFGVDFNRNIMSRFYIKNVMSNLFKSKLAEAKSTEYKMYNNIYYSLNSKDNINLYSSNLLPQKLMTNPLNEYSDVINKTMFPFGSRRNPWLSIAWFRRKRVHRGLINIANKALISPNLLDSSINTNINTNINEMKQQLILSKRHLHTNNNNNNIPNYLQLIVFSINRMFGRLNKSSIGENNKWENYKLANILSKFFNNKNVKMVPIQLKYEYNNIDILMKLIKNSMDDENQRNIDRTFRKVLINRRLRLESSDKVLDLIKTRKLTMLNDMNNKMLNMNNKLQNINLNSNLNNLNNKSYNDVKELLTMKDQKLNLSDYLLNKYLVGIEFGYKGKFGSSWGKRRSNKFLFHKGTFRNYLIEYGQIKHQQYKLNYIKPGISKGYIGKHTFSGKVGIKLALNRI
uniref:Ribosomal protein S3 n=1 Tax=Ogataea parapolymorpha (strain ATCC 26012 / BCRC 20466 / JCM 22074 / NRRL Y-7560 / DL-1) TaxID=871575 RepID=E7E841_OGAPD|nr:ribosomal protein S3 [Ogataea polymorpha]ADT63572.1 ribosomal protein S3 [Ogataea polymorpha]